MADLTKDKLEKILEAADEHGGSCGDAEVVIGDLQDLARDLFKLLTPEQCKQFEEQADHDWDDFITFNLGEDE